MHVNCARAPSRCVRQKHGACTSVCVFGERGAMREGGKEGGRLQSSNVKSPRALLSSSTPSPPASLAFLTPLADSPAASALLSGSASQVKFGILPFLPFAWTNFQRMRKGVTHEWLMVNEW